MTQHEKVLRLLVKRQHSGVTIRDGFELGVNWMHKRIRELEEMGVTIKRVDDEHNGTRFRRYILAEPDKAVEILERFEKKRGA